MNKRVTIVLTILLILSIAFSNRVLKFSTARNVELIAVFTTGLIAGLLVSTALPTKAKDKKED